MVDKIYRAANVSQVDGSPLQFSNCRMAVLATHLDFHTKGKKTSTGAKMRSFQDDQIGGSDSSDARIAWERGYGEKLVIRDGQSWERLLEDRSRLWFVSLDVWYASLPERRQANASFGHSIGVAPENNGSQWLVGDPLRRDGAWNWMESADLKQAAEDWGRRILAGASGKTHGPDGEDAADTGGAVPIRYTTAVEAAPMLRILDGPAMTGDIAIGTQVYNHNGQPASKTTQKSVGSYSPFATRIGTSVPARAVYRTLDGVMQLILLRTVDFLNAKPVASPVVDVDKLLDERDAAWLARLTPPR